MLRANILLGRKHPLTQLDMEGKKITRDMAELYVLKNSNVNIKSNGARPR